MSIDLIQLGEDIGEAKATAEAALEVAEVATALEAVTTIPDSDGDEEHECCEHCERNIAELRAMLVSLSDKYDEDMDLIARVLDELLTEVEEPEEAEEDEAAVEVIEPEKAEEEHGTGSESAADQSGGAGHAEAGASGERESSAEEAPKPEKREHKRPSTSSRIRFARGRR